MANGPGGKIPNQGNPPAAKGVGKNSKRHDLERQATPGLHGSDLQQGDIKKLEQGQRIAPIRTQAPAAPKGQSGQPGGQTRKAQSGGPMQVPDAIEFLGGKQGSELDQSLTPLPPSEIWPPAVPLPGSPFFVNWLWAQGRQDCWPPLSSRRPVGWGWPNPGPPPSLICERQMTLSRP